MAQSRPKWTAVKGRLMRSRASYARVVALLCVGAGFAGFGQAANTRMITVNTSQLVGHPAGPFSLAFQLTDGGGTGNASNTVTVSRVQFGGGSASESPVSTGGASGSLAASVTLTDSAFVNYLYQPFVPGSQLTFVVSVTGNLGSGQIPDRFSFSILDRTGAEIPTLAGEDFDQILAVDINSSDPTFQIFAGDTSRTPEAGGNAITISVPSVLTDVTPPTLSISLSPNTLWPANHKLISVSATLQVRDDLDTSPRATLVSIISNEPDNGLGDGDTHNDIQDALVGTDDRTFLLRAERSGIGHGRIYMVTYRATDFSGNVTEATGLVTVPGKKQP